MTTQKEKIKFTAELVAAYNSGAVTSDGLMHIFKKHNWHIENFQAANPLPNNCLPYSRVVMSSDLECEVMLARWSRNATCAPHDHGTSEGFVFFLEGRFEETAYSFQDGRLIRGGSIWHSENSSIAVNKGEIHSCVCVDEGLSLHIYFPRISRMTVYDVAKNRTLVVSDECGAWIPENQCQIIEEHTWKKISQNLTF